ncbi:ABC transporter permease [Actinotalea fermentans]|uniref:Tetronasin ABC transporter integral membrane protein n=1 Tax=Actinotalea fermentans TaxID=43671 RepID=A0A511YUS7_9CELL|nr:ABC transporter permease [Actinotalea fermentans]KGM17956.1 ABC transporter permease [Actinotalea fermentans ATCC 43279 = JCM 9966 = DSM 3133]GEN78947.1 tetronasin ABC transporter integral membrane protein [Actinotalea fermentans]
MTATLTAPTAAPVRAGAPADALAGIGTMVRLVVRRNRVRLGVWVVVLVGMLAYVASYYQEIFPTQASLDDFAALSDTPGIRALTGLSPAADTLGGAVWTKSWMTIALSLAIGVAFLVVRNGRADEEAGRTELLRSRMLGVHAYGVASWLVNGALCVVVGLGVAFVSASGGLDPDGAGVAGSLVLGASVTGVGLVGLGIGAVAGQVTTTSRGANALASGVIVGCYVLRMIGDLGDGTLTWASPIGWGQEMQPFGANRVWPLALLVLLAAGLLGVAAALEARRDLGAGLVPERAGRPGAPERYTAPLGLGLRLQRGPVIGWSVTVVLCGLLFGSIIEAMNELIADAEAGPAQDFLRGSGVDALLAMLASMIGLVTAVFATQSAVSLRADEASGIIEPQLAGALSRRRWAWQRLAIPIVGSAALLALGGTILGAVHGSLTDDASAVGTLAGAALAYWPAVMVLVGVAVALFGWLPRLAIPLTWGFMAAMWFATMLGEVFGLPQWLLDGLPFSAVPYVPAEPMAWTPLLLLTLVAAGLAWSGVERFARRDVQPG